MVKVALQVLKLAAFVVAFRLALCLPVYAENVLKPTNSSDEAGQQQVATEPQVRIASFYPQGTYGLFLPGQLVQLTLVLTNASEQPRSVNLFTTVRDFDEQLIHRQQEPLTLEPNTSTEYELLVPAQWKLGFYSVRTEVREGAERLDQVIRSFCVVASPEGPNDPFFGFSVARKRLWMIDALRLIGMGTASIFMDWTREREPGEYDWASKDREVDLLGKAGFRMLGSHQNHQPDYRAHVAPQWELERIKHRRQANQDPYPDEHFEAYGRFVETMVNRYKDQIHTWYLMNEIDKPMRTDPQAPMEYYVKKVKAFAQAAKRADPDCRVVGLGVAGNDATKKPPYPAARRIWAQVHPYLDGFWPHPYAWPRYIGGERRVQIPESFFRKALYDALDMIRPSGKANLGISENGYACPPDTPINSAYGKEMARLTARTMILARSIPEVECILYFTVFECGEGGFAYGLWELEGGGSLVVIKQATPETPVWPRPVVAAYATVARFLSHVSDPHMLQADEEVCGCAFKTDRGWVIPLWTTRQDPAVFEVELPGEIDVYDLMGNRVTRIGPGPVEVNLTDAPVFLVGSQGSYDQVIEGFEAGVARPSSASTD